MCYDVLLNMLSLHLEKFQSVHDEKFYPCVILTVNDQRRISTENLDYLLQSPETLSKDDTTVVIEWDRNYMEGVSLDNDMLHLVESPLYLHSIGQVIVLEYDGVDGRDVLTAIPISEWKDVISNLKELYDKDIYRCTLSL